MRLHEEVPLSSFTEQTRILELHCQGTDEDEAVKCTLSIINLKSAQDFEALSYCWGDRTTKKTICVNDHDDVQVTENLESALRHLRIQGGSRKLWVDALCIDQLNVPERSTQVSIMHEIYQKATRTVSWLGSGKDDGELAMEFLQWYAGRKLMMHPVDVDGHHEGYEESGWAAVTKLLDRPYWRRLWIMQEIAFSAAQPVVACGRKFINWHLLLAALGDSALAYNLTRLNRVRGSTKKVIQSGKARIRDSHRASDIIFLLSHSTGFETSEPRDRVYALYGLFRVAGIVNFQPDYSRTVDEVFQQITEFILSTKGGLNFLEMRSHEQSDGSPSWVVDLSLPPPLSFHRTDTVVWQRSGVPLPEFTRTMSSEGTARDILNVPGILIDKISSVDAVRPCIATALWKAGQLSNAHAYGGKSLRASNLQALQYWDSKCDAGHSHYLCRNTIEYLASWADIIWRLTGDMKPANQWTPGKWDWKQMLAEAPDCQTVHDDSDTSNEFSTRYEAALKPLLCMIGLKLFGRICFTTEKGFVGVGLSGMRQNDLIVAFHSTKSLHALRSTGSSHRYVGALMLTDARDYDSEAENELSKVYGHIWAGKIASQMFSIE